MRNDIDISSIHHVTLEKTTCHRMKCRVTAWIMLNP